MKCKLELIVFISGAVVMMLEIAAARVLAPSLGTTIITWTSIIGVILASLSGGYYFGGKPADKGATLENISFVLALAATSILFTVIVKDLILESLADKLGIQIGSLIASLILFAPASFLLGMISPYAAKISLIRLESSGSTVGNLYALSTFGSIAGTFLTGFFLLEYFGTTDLLFLLAFALLILSFLASGKKLLILKLLLLIMIVSAYVFFSIKRANLEQNNEITFDTRYNWFLLKDTVKKDENGVPSTIRILTTRLKAAQSAIYLESPDDVPVTYMRYFRLADHFKANPLKTLLLGGGAFIVARDFLARHSSPEARIDAVEIDEDLPKIAKKYFYLKEDPRLTIYGEDARTFINSAKSGGYDAIFIDVFGNSLAIPFQLTTRETVKHLFRLLTSDGVAMLNIISPLSGEGAKFLLSEYATYASIFPQVYAFRVQDQKPEALQNIIFVALKSKVKPSWENSDEEFQTFLSTKTDIPILDDTLILTDDFAPVDQYIARINF